MTAKRLIISDKEKSSVLSLPGVRRYSYFIKRVADWETAWGLWDEGWALAADDDGREAFPLWPAKEYAESCAVDEWAGYQPEEIAVVDLLDELLPKLVSKNVSPAVFPTPSSKGVILTATQLETDLRSELEQYE